MQVPRVGKAVYLSRPGDLPGFTGSSLWDELTTTVRGATKVDVLTAFYSADFLIQLLEHVGNKKERKACKVRIVVTGATGPALLYEKQQLRMIKTRLHGAGFADVQVRMFATAPLFHTKLFRIVRSTQPTWYVGSANASNAIRGDNHELMLKLSGAHEALAKYVEATIAASESVEKSLPPTDIRSLASFLQSGQLAWQSSRVSLFAFSVFDISPNERQLVGNALAQRVRNAGVRTTGLDFSLKRALGNQPTTSPDGNGAQGPSKAGLRRYSIACSLGDWLPEPYESHVRKATAKVEARRLSDLIRFRDNLRQKDKSSLLIELHAYIDDVQGVFKDVQIQKKPTQGFEDRFDTFIDKVRSRLEDQDFLDRESKIQYIDPVPALTPDQPGFQRFADSFLEELAFRISYGGRNEARIVNAIRSQLKLPRHAIDPDTLRGLMEGHLEQFGWNQSAW
jgi:hypothetical protein